MLVGALLLDRLRLIVGWLGTAWFLVLALVVVWVGLSDWFGWSVVVVDWAADCWCASLLVVARCWCVWWSGRWLGVRLVAGLFEVVGLIDWVEFAGCALGWLWVVVDLVWFFGLLWLVRDFRVLVRWLAVELVGLLIWGFWFCVWFVVCGVPWLCSVGFSVCSFLLGRL